MHSHVSQRVLKLAASCRLLTGPARSVVATPQERAAWLAQGARAGPGPGAAQHPPAALPALPPAAGRAPGPGTPRPLVPAAPPASTRRSACPSYSGYRPGPRSAFFQGAGHARGLGAFLPPPSPRLVPWAAPARLLAGPARSVAATPQERAARLA